MMFKPATRKRVRLRMALMGPTGSGKTYSALRIGQGLLAPGQRLAVIDTEHGSAAVYAGQANPDGGVFEFDAVEIHEWDGKFSIPNYIKAIDGAAAAGYPVLVVDSLSHAWAGQGGALEMVDKKAAASRSGNSYTAWRDVTPLHNGLVDALLSYPGHVVVTMRSKMAYVMEENSRGKVAPKKIGLQPIQRDGLEYEFTIVGDMHETKLVVSKTRFSDLTDEVIDKPGAELAHKIRAWLDEGNGHWHDERWEAEKARFFAALGKTGNDYDAACAALEEYRPGMRPSQVGTEGRRELLERLG